MRKLAIISVVLCVVLAILFCSCGYADYRNKRPDDELSKLVQETFGEDIYYDSKDDSQDIKCYYYLLMKEDKEVIKEFILVVDEALSQSSEKTIVYLACQIPGGLEYLILLANYSDDSLDKANLDGAKEIHIRYSSNPNAEVFKDPTIYTVLEDIQYLVIDEELQKIAEEQGIDWYAVWPTLEEMWVRSGSEKIKVERDTE